MRGNDSRRLVLIGKVLIILLIMLGENVSYAVLADDWIPSPTTIDSNKDKRNWFQQLLEDILGTNNDDISFPRDAQMMRQGASSSSQHEGKLSHGDKDDDAHHGHRKKTHLFLFSATTSYRDSVTLIA